MAGFDKHDPGTFCYVELASPDPDASGRFYGSLFGWERNDQDTGEHGVYTQFQLAGRIAGAMHKLMPEQEAQNVSPHWALYIAVADVEAATSKASELGGNVLMGPMDVMDAGRMTVLSDPQGATFCLWEAKAHAGIQVRDEVNALCWSELMATDTAAATNFYGGLLGWEPHTSDTEGMRDYTSFMAAGAPTAGLMAIPSEMDPIPPNWLAYFQAADCARTEAQAVGLGASALVPTTDIPDIGRFAVIQDPQGAVFGLFQSLAG